MKTIIDNEEEKKKNGDFNIVFIGHPPRAKQKLKIENEVYDISFDGFKNEKHNEERSFYLERKLFIFLLSC